MDIDPDPDPDLDPEERKSQQTDALDTHSSPSDPKRNPPEAVLSSVLRSVPTTRCQSWIFSNPHLYLLHPIPCHSVLGPFFDRSHALRGNFSDAPASRQETAKRS
jgi:hypothetical protein